MTNKEKRKRVKLPKDKAYVVISKHDLNNGSIDITSNKIYSGKGIKTSISSDESYRCSINYFLAEISDSVPILRVLDPNTLEEINIETKEERNEPEDFDLG